MPFLAAAPVLASLIGGGASIGSSIIGGKLSKAKPSPLENQVNQANLNAMNQGRQLSGELTPIAKNLFNQGQGYLNQYLPQGQNLLNMGAGTYQPVLNYWSQLLSGNRAGMTSALAPEILRIGQGYDQAARTSSALMPRGGARADVLGQMPFNQQRDISTLFQQARPQAASGLLNAGNAAVGAGGDISNLGLNLFTGASNTGSNILQNALNALYGGTAGGRDILQQQQNMRNLEVDRGNKMGAGIFDMFQRYGMPALTDWLKKRSHKPMDENPWGSAGDPNQD